MYHGMKESPKVICLYIPKDHSLYPEQYERYLKFVMALGKAGLMSNPTSLDFSKARFSSAITVATPSMTPFRNARICGPVSPLRQNRLSRKMKLLDKSRPHQLVKRSSQSEPEPSSGSRQPNLHSNVIIHENHQPEKFIQASKQPEPMKPSPVN